MQMISIMHDLKSVHKLLVDTFRAVQKIEKLKIKIENM